MKPRYFVLLFLVIALLSPCHAQDSFQGTITELRTALLKQDFKTLNAHVSIHSIVKNRVGQLSSHAKKEKSIIKRAAAKLAGLGEPILTKSIAHYILSKYKKSSTATRTSYLKSFNLSRFTVKEKVAYASGSFLGKPVSITAVKLKERWVIVGAFSEVLDTEMRKLLKFI